MVIATLAQDYAFGRDGMAAFRAALAPTGAKLVHEEYAPPTTTDFTAPTQRIFDALAKEQGEKILFVLWAGADPMTKLAAMDPGRAGHEAGHRRQHPAGAAGATSRCPASKACRAPPTTTTEFRRTR